MRQFILVLFFSVVFCFPVWGFKMEIPTATLFQGETLLVRVKGAKEGDYKLYLAQKKYPLYSYLEDQKRGLVGIPCDFKPGQYQIKVEQILSGKTTTKTKMLRVKEKGFPRGKYPFAKKKMKPKVAKVVDKQRRTIISKLKQETPVINFPEKFVMPLTGKRISGEYGEIRVYTNRYTSRHKGTDIAAKSNTKIFAPAAGRVILTARKYLLQGNMIILDHGQGVVSVYMHLCSIKVKEGQFVTQGQLIGRVGCTGLAFGPHLHWGIYVHGVAVDPMFWVNTGLKIYGPKGNS